MRQVDTPLKRRSLSSALQQAHLRRIETEANFVTDIEGVNPRAVRSVGDEFRATRARAVAHEFA